MGTLNQDGRIYQILRRWVASGYYFEYDEYDNVLVFQNMLTIPSITIGPFEKA